MIIIISSQSYAVFHKISELSLYNFTSWIEIDNNLAIIGTDEPTSLNCVCLVDISDPENPLIIEELYDFLHINNIAIKDSIAYVCDDNGLKLIDYNDLSNIIINTYFSSEDVHHVNINEDQAVFVYSNGFEIIDVSNASSPVQIVSIDTGYYVERAEIIDDFLYLMVEDGIKIFDISQINDPVLLGEYIDDFYNLDSFAVHNEKIYIADWTGIIVIDISDPTSPSFITMNPNFLLPHNISIQNDILYLCGIFSGFSMYDIEDINNPVLVNTYSTPREAVHYAIQDEILYLIDWSYGLQVVDMDDSINPYEVYRYFDEFSYVEGFDFTDDYIYYADMLNGLGIYERTNPTEPIYLTGDEMGTNIIYINNLVYLSYRTGSSSSVGIKIYDVSNPESPVLINTLIAENYQTKIIGDHLFFKNGIYTVRFYDISDPANPVYINYIYNSHQIVSYQIKNDLLFANLYDPANDINGIEIYDISDLENPESISYIPLDYEIYDLNVFQNVIYAGYYNLTWYGSASGYFIIDFSDPYNPIIVNEFYVHSLNNNRGVGFGSINCNLSGNNLVIADNRSNRILTYDASDITNPVLQNEFRWNLQTSSINFDGESLILNNWVNGITELDWNQFLPVNEDVIVAKKILLTNYPNPFNPTTTISFSIPNESNISISIYNIKGQKIKSLVTESFETGNHSIVWNGDDESGKAVSSGVYLYKLSVNGVTDIIKKCMLLK